MAQSENVDPKEGGSGGLSGLRVQIAAVLLILTASLLATFILNGHHLHGGWADDDDIYIRQLSGLDLRGLVGLFDPRSQGGWFYRPTFQIRFAITLMLTPVASLAYVLHLENLLLHALTTTLLAWLAYRLTRSYRSGIVVGLCFTLVTKTYDNLGWISAGSAQDATVWTLVTLHLWLSYRKSNSVWCFLACLVAFWFAIGSKQEALFLPLGLLALDIYLVPVTSRNLSLRMKLYAPFAVVFLVGLGCNVIAYSLAGDHSSLHSTGEPARGLDYLQTDYPLARLRNVIVFLSYVSFNVLNVRGGWLIPILVAYSSFRIVKERDRLLAMIWLAATTSAIVVALEGGAHAVLMPRLYYMPAMFFTLFGMLFLTRFDLSKTIVDRVLCGGLLIHLLAELGITARLDLWASDLIIIYPILSLLGAAYVAYRTGRISAHHAIPPIFIGLSRLIQAQIPIEPPGGWELTAIVVTGALYRRQWYYAPLMISLYWLNPLTSMPMMLAMGLQWKQPEHAPSPDAIPLMASVTEGHSSEPATT